MAAFFTDTLFLSKARKEASHLMGAGAALLLIGVVALMFPIISSLVASVYVGWVLIFSGVAILYGAFALHRTGRLFAAQLLGLLSLAGGVFILARPVGAEVAITLCLGAVFLVQGAFELSLAFEIMPFPGWAWMLVSALASTVLSLVILAGWPGVSLVALGAVMGVNFVSSGLAFLMVGATALRGARTV